MENEKFNKEILDLWRKYHESEPEATKRYPLFYPKFKINCDILFIGINPSFDLKKEKEFEFENPIFDIQKAIDDERNAKDESHEKHYPIYYTQIWEITKGLKKDFKELKWEHIDILLIREKTQTELDYLKYDSKRSRFNNFGEDQFEIFLKIVNEINPKIIIIINKFASEILKNKLKDRITNESYFEKNGFDRISIKDKDNIPILFYGYLGSGRLDIYSRENLRWNIKRILNLCKN